MKKFLLFAVIAVSGLSASAQTNQGQWLVGGNGSLTTTKEGDFKETIFSLSPNAGYFVIDNLAVGARLNVVSHTDKVGDNKETNSTLAVGPFVRYYFLSLAGDKVKLFGDAGIDFGSDKFKETDEDTQTDKFTHFNISAGPAIFLSPNVALELAIGFDSKKYKDADDAASGLGLKLGFQIHLGDGKK